MAAVHTLAELKLSGNHLKGSRPVLSFHKVCWSVAPGQPLIEPHKIVAESCLWQGFDEQPHLQLLKEMLSHTFAVPKKHNKSKPFFDHVIAFSVADNRIWIRNYQVLLLTMPKHLSASPACHKHRCMAHGHTTCNCWP